jgi:hypothetical protein
MRDNFERVLGLAVGGPMREAGMLLTRGAFELKPEEGLRAPVVGRSSVRVCLCLSYWCRLFAATTDRRLGLFESLLSWLSGALL